MSKKKLVKHVDYPDLAVIDEAIRIIKTNERHYTCMALRLAACRVNHWRDNDTSRYRDQYRAFVYCTRGKSGMYPIWWNSTAPYKRHRLSALRAFRQACIDAAKN